MKSLSTSITKKGFTYEQVLREGQLAIYSQRMKEEGQTLAYEVIKIKQAPAHERGGVLFPAMELYPSERTFGIDGWSYGTFGDLSAAYEKALQKFKALSK